MQILDSLDEQDLIINTSYAEMPQSHAVNSNCGYVRTASWLGGFFLVSKQFFFTQLVTSPPGRLSTLCCLGGQGVLTPKE